MNKLATVEKIHSIQPHFNADSLEVAKVKEFPVVIKKGEYQDGELIVFIRIDSIVPFDYMVNGQPYFQFLERQKYRIWNARFRGAPSQGLVCPIDILDIDGIRRQEGYVTASMWAEEGVDVTEKLRVTKYEKGLDSSICGDAKGGFPTHLVSITDEDNLLNFPEVLEEFRGLECYLSIKQDGSSMTTILYENQVMVCSRRLEQKEGTGFWKIAEKYNLPEQLKLYGKTFEPAGLAIQAEACGGKIQGNPLGLSEQQMFVFNIKNTITGEWHGYYTIKSMCSAFNIPMVPLFCEPFIFDNTWSIDRLQECANKVTYVGSDGIVRKGEGLVLRTTQPKYSPVLGKMLSVKILNQDYK